MNLPIIQLTARQLFGQKRTVLLALGALLPMGIAILYRTGGGDLDAEEFTADILLGEFVVGTLLPLCALIFGTAALGSEIEDGTAVYLLSKPIPRRVVVLSKLVVAWGATAAVVALAAVASGVVGLGGVDNDGILIGFVIAIIAGAFLYNAIFLLLSIVTSRALVAGLFYVFIWEGVMTRLFTGIRVFSVRQYTLGFADGIVTAPPSVFNPPLSPVLAVVLMVAVSAAAVVLAVRRLRVWEIGEST